LDPIHTSRFTGFTITWLMLRTLFPAKGQP
jgi:hypothetical protein